MVDVSSFEAEAADLRRSPLSSIKALMFFPHDPAKVFEFLNAIKAAAFRDVLMEMSEEAAPVWGTGFTAWLAAYAGRWEKVREEAFEPAVRGVKGNGGIWHGGVLAGLTLLVPLVIWRKDPSKRPGRGAAYKVLAPFGPSKRTLQANWMKYRSVAHLWAAYELLDGFPTNACDGVKFVALALQIRDEAGAYVPFREREALLPLDVSIDFDAPRDSPSWIDRVKLPPDILKVALSRRSD
jgi:hypothetical protein